MAVLAATALAAPLKSCSIKYNRHTAVEYVDIVVTKTVYVTEGAAPKTTHKPKPKPKVVTTVVYVPPAPVYTPEPSPTPEATYQQPVYNAPAPEPEPVKPSPAPAPQVVSNPAPTSEDQKCLDSHNQFRAAHGAPALKWNQEMADYARDKTTDCTMHHSGGQYGENLAFGYSDVVAAVTAWYDEKDQYSSGTGFSMGTGHFTQLVWKATTELGCYNRQCGGSQYLMCEYSSPGNVVGNNNQYFNENVQM